MSLRYRTSWKQRLDPAMIRVIDVGCAEGYYAVGLAWRMPQTEIIAFDIDPMARRQTRRLAAMVRVSG